MPEKIPCHVCSALADQTGFCPKHKELWRSSPEAYRYSYWFTKGQEFKADVALKDFITRMEAEDRNGQ